MSDGKSVYVHGNAEVDELGFWTVTIDHSGFPKLRFLMGISPDGAVSGFTVCDRRFLARPPEPIGTSEKWGTLTPITRRLLERLPFGELERAARSFVNAELRDLAAGRVKIDDEAAGWIGQLGDSLGERKRVGRPRKSDRELAEFARDLVEVLQSSSSPIKDLARDRYTSPNTIKYWREKAKERGLLATPNGDLQPAKGKALEVVLTARARRILEHEGETNG